jgi:hypothetical protein
VGGRLLYPDGKILGQFGPVVGNSGKVSSLLLQYADGMPLSSARFDASSQKISWQGWNPDGSLLGQIEATSPGESQNPQISAWQKQQESLEQEIGLSFPPEFNLLPK